jgi:hypothetical protein
MHFVLAFRPARVMLPWLVTSVFIHRQIVRFLDGGLGGNERSGLSKRTF